MKKQYQQVLNEFLIYERGWICNTIHTMFGERSEILKDFKQRLSIIDETDPDLWDKRRLFVKTNNHTAKYVSDTDGSVWIEPDAEVRIEYLKRIISRL